ncbi:MAG: hypothetical protein WDZ76_10475 [Pseudohongiellaceae bacterium]
MNIQSCGSEIRKKTAMALAISLVASTAAAQQTDRFTVSGYGELGAEYNSNVSITELESATGESDTAAVLDAGLDLSWSVTERLNADAGYSYSSSSYRNFDDFDLDLHLLYGDLSYEFDALTLGTSINHADARLAGDDFLTLDQYSLYAGKLLGDQWYLRGALNFSDKSFEGFSERDADVEGLGIDAFWFFNDGRSTLVFSYAYDDETAASSQFSYDANTVRMRYTNSLVFASKDAEFQLGLRLQDRNYKGLTPAISARRDDQQAVAEAQFELSLYEHLAIITRLEHGAYQSNLSSADYDETRASLAVQLSF